MLLHKKKAMGLAKANEVLFLNKLMSAKDFEAHGFVTRIINNNSDGIFLKAVTDIAKEAASLPLEAVKSTKQLVRDGLKAQLLDANDREMDVLVDKLSYTYCKLEISQLTSPLRFFFSRLLHEEFQASMMAFFSKLDRSELRNFTHTPLSHSFPLLKK